MATRNKARCLTSALLTTALVLLLAPGVSSVTAATSAEKANKSIMVMAPTGVAGNGDRVSAASSFWADVMPTACRQREYQYKNGQQAVPGTLCRYAVEWRYQPPGAPWSGWGNYWDSEGVWTGGYPANERIYLDHGSIELSFAKEGGPIVVGTKLQARVRGWRVSDTWKITWIGSGLSPVSVWDGTRVRPLQESPAGKVTKIMAPLQWGASMPSAGLTVQLDFYSDVLPDSCLFNFPTPKDPRPEDWSGWGERCAYVVFWRYRNPGRSWSEWDVTLGGSFAIPIDQFAPYGGGRVSHVVAGMAGTDVRRGAQVQAQVRTWLATDNSYRWGPSWSSPVLKTK